VPRSQEDTTGGKFNSLSPREYYSVECTGLEDYLVDCVWSIRTTQLKKMDVMVMCTQGGSSFPNQAKLAVKQRSISLNAKPYAMSAWIGR
jgi:hypothetical protein